MARITFHVVKLSRENRKMDFILKILTGKIFVRSGGGVSLHRRRTQLRFTVVARHGWTQRRESSDHRMWDSWYSSSTETGESWFSSCADTGGDRKKRRTNKNRKDQ